MQLTTDVPLRSRTAANYGQFLEVRLTSKTSLTALAREVDGIDGVYVDADFCPLRNEDGVIAFGPYDDERKDLSLPSSAPSLRSSSNGSFHYRIYVPVAYQAEPAPGQIQLPTYDLRKTDGDLCLRLFAPGYNITKSQSEPITVPAKLIREALKA